MNHFFGNEKKYLDECIKSNFVSSVGNFVNKFSKLLQGITLAKYVIPVVNGTSALHLSLISSNVKRNDEILVPSLTFVATTNAISYLGAIPHFVDIEKETLGINPDFLRKYLKRIGKLKNGYLINSKTGNRIKAIVPVHTFGHPCRIDDLVDLANEFNLVLIEDAAESLGSYFNKKHATLHFWISWNN